MATKKAKPKVRTSKPVPGPNPEDNWRARSDFESLQNAASIRADEARHAAALQHGQQQLQLTKSVLRKPSGPKKK